MKILYFYQYFSTSNGSWGTRVHDFTREWVKNGVEVTVVTSVYSKSDISAKKLIEIQYFEGVKVIILNVSINNRDSFFKRIYSFFIYSGLSCWYSLTERYDVAIASSGPITVGLPGIIAKKIKRKIMVFEVRDLWPDGAIELGIIKNSFLIRVSKWFEKVCYNSADLIVTLSIGMEKHIKNRLPSKPIITVTNAANVALFSTPVPWEAPEMLTPFKYAIYTGNIGEVNNAIWMLEAAKELQRLKREDIKILMIGDGQQREYIDSEIEKYGLKTLIRLGLMPKHKLVPLIQHALVSLVPLKGTPVLDSSSPNKFFESLSAGIPVIQNTNGWMKDYLTLHEVGFTIDPNKPKDLAFKLIELNSQVELVKKMGEKAKELAKLEFDKDQLSQKMLSAILTIK